MAEMASPVNMRVISLYSASNLLLVSIAPKWGLELLTWGLPPLDLGLPPVDLGLKLIDLSSWGANVSSWG